jgi:hypothetical protein
VLRELIAGTLHLYVKYGTGARYIDTLYSPSSILHPLPPGSKTQRSRSYVSQFGTGECHGFRFPPVAFDRNPYSLARCRRKKSGLLVFVRISARLKSQGPHAYVSSTFKRIGCGAADFHSQQMRGVYKTPARSRSTYNFFFRSFLDTST